MEEKNEFELEKNLIIISVPTIKKLLSYGEEGRDALLLYSFYYYTAKWQKTNQPKATPNFCMKGLHWGEKRFGKADKLLRDLNLVEKKPNRVKGRITGWYVKINYIWTTKKERDVSPEPLKSHPLDRTRVWTEQGSGSEGTNALSADSLNASSVNNSNALNVDKKNASSVFAKQGFADKEKKDDNPLEGEFQEKEKENSAKEREKNVAELIKMFEPINPTTYRLYNNITQRKAIKRMLDKFGYQKLEQIIKFLPKVVGREYAPTITTPVQLENKMAQLITYIQKEFRNKSKSKFVRV